MTHNIQFERVGVCRCIHCGVCLYATRMDITAHASAIHGRPCAIRAAKSRHFGGSLNPLCPGAVRSVPNLSTAYWSGKVTPYLVIGSWPVGREGDLPGNIRSEFRLPGLGSPTEKAAKMSHVNRDGTDEIGIGKSGISTGRFFG